MQFLKEREHEHIQEEGTAAAREYAHRPSHSRTKSTPAVRRRSDAGERAPLIRRHRSYNQDEPDATPEPHNAAGGTILGIHNLAIVFPQFIVSDSIPIALSAPNTCCSAAVDRSCVERHLPHRRCRY